MFNVGDKVTCLMNGKGIVVKSENLHYPVGVKFSDKYDYYTIDGCMFVGSKNPTLYHGHGTFKIEFVEDKEPEYEWQWLYLDNNGYYETTNFHKTEESIKTHYGVNTKIFYRIEESKREVKHG